jgi:hypothetical protein
VRPRRVSGASVRPLNFTVRCPMLSSRNARRLLIASCAILFHAVVAVASEDNPSPCQITPDAVVSATLTTAGADGQIWNYEVHSGGSATLRIQYLLSPMGEVSGSFSLDPGEINYAICVAETASFFALPSQLESRSAAAALHAPDLIIKITRAGSTKTVEVYDPRRLGNRDDLKRFLRVWDRIFSPVPLKPIWDRASNNRWSGP